MIATTKERLQHLAQTVANAIAKQYNLKHGARIPLPLEVTFDLELREPKTAGMAWTQRSPNERGVMVIKAQRVELNMTLYEDNVREFLNTVIPHEVAHLDQAWRDQAACSRSADHGYVWQASMRAMAQVPRAKHSMDTSKAEEVYKQHKAKIKAAKKKAAALKE